MTWDNKFILFLFLRSLRNHILATLDLSVDSFYRTAKLNLTIKKGINQSFKIRKNRSFYIHNFYSAPLGLLFAGAGRSIWMPIVMNRSRLISVVFLWILVIFGTLTSIFESLEWSGNVTGRAWWTHSIKNMINAWKVSFLTVNMHNQPRYQRSYFWSKETNSNWY